MKAHAGWVVADGAKAARWERLWASLGLTPRRAARLEDLEAGRGLALVDVAALRPDPASALKSLRAKRHAPAVVACSEKRSSAPAASAAAGRSGRAPGPAQAT
ncbi:hypothetical protein EPO15_17865, partial [bacterium]